MHPSAATPAPTPVTGTGTQQPPVPPAQGPPAVGTPGVVAASSVAAIVLGACVWYVVKHKKANSAHMFLAGGLGLTLAGSVIGRAFEQVIASLIAALVNVTGNL